MARALIIAAVLFGASVAHAQASTDPKLGPHDNDKNLMRAFGVPQTAKKVAVSTTTARTSADFVKNEFVKVVCTTAVHFKLGDSTVTATTSDEYLPADSPDWFYVGTNTRIAFITSTGTGDCYVTRRKTVLGET